MTKYLCAVDVGTRSARAGLFLFDGTMVGREVEPFPVHEEQGLRAEYSSDAIWAAVCTAVQRLVAPVPAADIAALAFDATCSLVLRDRSGAALPLGPDGRDTIAWFDHRAVAEAAECTATDHSLIGHLGGAMSPEMQTPKLMWVKRHRPDLWEALGEASDLTDHLTRRAVGHPVHSACTLAAKWPYLPQSGGWQQPFLHSIGLEDLTTRLSLPDQADPVASIAGRVSDAAAQQLGLAPGTPVATGLIDAFAGALGSLGPGERAKQGQRLALIAGTSNCIMAITDRPIAAPGVWGPYRDAILPGYWVSEGGQSASGALLDYLLDCWRGEADIPVTHDAVLDRITEQVAEHGPAFARDIQVLPDFNGNRSPFADPTARGVISGLTLDRSFDGLCALYWRTAVALAHGVRQIVEHMGKSGLAIEVLSVTGGLTRSPLMMQLFADATGLAVRQSGAADSVLLGSAIAASVAAGQHPDLDSAAKAMCSVAQTYHPQPDAQALHARDYEVFRLMQKQRQDIARMIGS